MLKETLNYLAEPITKNSLSLEESDTFDIQILEGVLRDQSGKEYKIHEGLADLIPKKDYLSKDAPLLESWCKLQESGKKLYDDFPHLNLSVKGRKDVETFKEFSTFHGKVLDVGCGPIIPAYLQNNEEVEYAIGIDPLVSSYKYNKTESIDLLKAIGEFMPFRDKIFDVISFATSFDHVIDPKRVLEETKRLLKKDGQIIFWIEGKGPSDEEKNNSKKSLGKFKSNSKIKQLARKTIKVTKKQIKMFKNPEIKDQAKIVNSMKVPEGAVDKFHLRHLHYNEFNQMCQSVGLKVVEKMEMSKFRSTLIKYKIS